MAQLRDVVVDCHRPSALARFWADALDDYQVAPYDDAELERLAGLGIHDVADDPTVLVERIDGGLPRVWFQRVPEPKSVKNRVHLDVTARDRHAELARLTRLGASVVDEQDGWTVLADPEGNEFCLFPAA
ncbi:VOC family protein [Georgenia alba]|uniref:VOC family protein n=1 Tax=Georgenia alba TaxID=2233858 RepID=A0ABW2Q861_9MICO